MSSKITLADLKWAAKHFPYTVKEQMELDGFDDVIEISEVQDEIREYMDKRQRLESNLVGVNRYIDCLKKELFLNELLNDREVEQ